MWTIKEYETCVNSNSAVPVELDLLFKWEGEWSTESKNSIQFVYERDNEGVWKINDWISGKISLSVEWHTGELITIFLDTYFGSWA